MKTNMGTIDRVMRTGAAVLFMLLYLINNTTAAWNYFFLLTGIFLLLTAIIGICPVYALIGMNTKEKGREHGPHKIDHRF